MEEKVVRKTTTKRMVRKTAARKAPTQVADTVVRGERERRTLLPFAAIGIFVVIVGASIAVGFSDDGQINVENTINNKRQHGTEEEKQALESIPVQRARPSAPNGGLVPTTDPDPDAPAAAPVEVGTSTATSTDEATEDAEGETEAETAETTETTEEAPVEPQTTEAPAEEAPPADETTQ